MSGVSAKVRRAECAIRSLEAEMGRTCQGLKRYVVHEINQDEGRHYWIYRGQTPGAPVEWSVRTGETLYNLRSALDHLVWQLVLRNGEEPGERNEFPFVRKDEDWSKLVKQQSVKCSFR